MSPGKRKGSRGSRASKNVSRAKLKPGPKPKPKSKSPGASVAKVPKVPRKSKR